MCKRAKYHCPNCGPVSITATKAERREETYSVKGKPITLTANVRTCVVCGQDLYDRELDSANIDAAYDLYRAQFGPL